MPTGAMVISSRTQLTAKYVMVCVRSACMACVAWPTGELGGMGLEGAVRLGYRKELEAITDDSERDELFEKLVSRLYESGKAVSVASHFEIDDVIDPAETRKWINAVLESYRPPRDVGRRRPNIDTW